MEEDSGGGRGEGGSKRNMSRGEDWKREGEEERRRINRET